MKRSVRFETLDLQPEQAAAVCPLCAINVAAFGYMLTGEDDGDRELCGRCCLQCAQQLLTSTHELLMAEWRSDPPPPQEDS